MNIGSLDRQIEIHYPAAAQDSTYGTPTITWTLLATVWANVQDVPPSRAEAVQQGLTVARNLTRIRYRYRSDVTSAMRITILGATSRSLQIIGGPATLGRNELSEIVCESVSS